MGPFVGIAFFTVFIGIFVVAIVVGLRNEKKRRELLQTFASQMGLTYLEKLNAIGEIPCHEAGVFQKGRSKRAKNFMSGKIADVDVMLMDYQYTTGSGKNSTTHNLTLAAYRMPGLELPDFALEGENFLTRFAEKFGMQDIDFESHPQFSKTYRLSGKDENAIRQLFTSTLLTSIENGLIPKDVRVQSGAGWLIIYSYPKRVKTENMQDFLNDTFDLANKLTVDAMS
ncbi:MAG: hypothetical protein ACF8OB_05820 [Phycisphaeraceae bacterium JB051]